MHRTVRTVLLSVRAAAAGDAVLSPGVTGAVIRRMLQGGTPVVAGGVIGDLGDVLPYAVGGKYDSVLVKAEPGEAAGLERGIRSALGNSPLLKVQSQEQLTKESFGEIDLMLDMMYGLLGMAVIIGVLGVINTLAMSVYERTHEIGMLRAIGLDRTGIRRMVRLESVVISLFGAILGIGTGVFLAWTGGSLTVSGLPHYTTAALATPGPVPRPGPAHRRPRRDLAGQAGGSPEHAAGDQRAVKRAPFTGTPRSAEPGRTWAFPCGASGLRAMGTTRRARRARAGGRRPSAMRWSPRCGPAPSGRCGRRSVPAGRPRGRGGPVGAEGL